MKPRRKLRELRKALELTQEDMALAADFTKQAYSQLEHGRMAARPERMVPLNKLLRLCRTARIEHLRNEIAYLQGFDIDESLYLTE